MPTCLVLKKNELKCTEALKNWNFKLLQHNPTTIYGGHT